MTELRGPEEPSRRLLWLACLSGGFGQAMTAQVAFLVPLRARELGADFGVIGLIIGAGGLAAALASVPSGAVIDRLGPRRAFVVGTTATGLLSLLYVLVTSFWWFFALQPLVGLARNLGWVASQSHITGIGTAQQRPTLTGRFSFFGSVGQMAGPVLVGGVAQLAGFRGAFLFSAGYALAFALLGLRLADTRGADHAGTRKSQGLGARSAVGLLAVRGMQVALVLSFARVWINRVYSAFLPVVLVESGLGPGVVGTVMATSGLVAAAVAPTAGFWLRWVSQRSAAVIGLGCGAAGLLLAPHATTVPIVYVVPALVGIGAGLSLPLLLGIVAGAAPDSRRGVALGLRGMVNQSAGTVAPVVIGPLIAALGLALGFTAGGLAAGVLLAAAGLLPASDRHTGAAG